MTKPLAVMFLLGSMAGVAAQESPGVPKDSVLVSINGCAKNGIFTVGERREDQPGTLDVEAGRRFRLQGPKKLLNDIKAHRRGVIQVTGLIRQMDAGGPQGIGVLGGRVRIGGARVPQDPIANPARDPAANLAVFEAQSWQQLTGDCR